MRLKNILFLSLLLSTGFASVTAANNHYPDNTNSVIGNDIYDDFITHIVKKGETVYSIATAYNITVEEIYRLNPNAGKGIKTGEKLKISKQTKPAKPIGYSEHLIEAKETLFSVARMYSVTVNDVKLANPGLDEPTFSIGKTIRIPKFTPSEKTTVVSATVPSTTVVTNRNIEYSVRKGETLYSIGKAHNVTVEALINSNPALMSGGLREGMTITIPSSRKGQVANNISISTNNKEGIYPTEIPYASKGELVRVGLLLPFLDAKGSIQKEKLAEYYEGFLLAVKNMKSKGLNAEIYAFDTGPEKDTEKLESLLGTSEMKSLHLLIGGISKQQIDVLTKFSKDTGIKYAIPFGSTKEANNNTAIFQITTSHSNLYPEIMAAFIERYRDCNVIFVNEAKSNNDKSDFVNELKKELSKANIIFKTAGSSNNLSEDIKAVLSTSKTNVLVPTSSAEITLRKVLSAANLLKNGSITLFGYPEWQIYSQHAASLHKYNSFIYSIFFVDENQGQVKDFVEEYKNWYNKNMVNSYPKYGLLGYDAGLYFLTALNKYGSNFEENVQNVQALTLQSAINFKFENGMFINEGLYFINYRTDSRVEKFDVVK